MDLSGHHLTLALILGLANPDEGGHLGGQAVLEAEVSDDGVDLRAVSVISPV